jgi:hypothetical protein
MAMAVYKSGYYYAIMEFNGAFFLQAATGIFYICYSAVIKGSDDSSFERRT